MSATSPRDQIGPQRYRYPCDLHGLSVTLRPNVASCISDSETELEAGAEAFADAVRAVDRMAADRPALAAEELDIVDGEHAELVLNVFAALRLERDIQTPSREG
jgi:hypothetical protein